MVLRCCASRSSALYGITTMDPAFASALITYLAKKPVDPNTVAVIPLTWRGDQRCLAWRCCKPKSSPYTSECREWVHLPILLTQYQDVVCLTDERPPGPAFMPLFKRVMPAVSSVAKPRQALVSPAIPEGPQLSTKRLPNQLYSQLS